MADVPRRAAADRRPLRALALATHLGPDGRGHDRRDPAGGRRRGVRRAASSCSAPPSSQVRRPSAGATTGSTPTATGRSRGPTSRSSRGPCRPSPLRDGGAGRGRASPSSCRCCWASCPGLLLLVLVASGWAYNAGLKRTAASGCPTSPASARCRPAWSPRPRARRSAPWWLVAAGAALGGAAHLANVAPDLEDDLATGVRGLPHRLGARVSAVLGAVLLGGASLLWCWAARRQRARCRRQQCVR